MVEALAGLLRTIDPGDLRSLLGHWVDSYLRVSRHDHEMQWESITQLLTSAAMAWGRGDVVQTLADVRLAASAHESWQVLTRSTRRPVLRDLADRIGDFNSRWFRAAWSRFQTERQHP